MPETSSLSSSNSDRSRPSSVSILNTHQTLLLGRDEKPMAYPLTLLNTKQTVNAIFLNRVDVVQWSNDYVLRGEQDAFRLPLVVRLKDYRQDVSLGMPVPYNSYNLYIRDEGMCQYSGKRVFWGHAIAKKCATQDHVLPRSYGGKTEWRNMVLASAYENNRKGESTLRQMGMKLHHLPWEPTAGDMLGLWVTSGALAGVPEAFRYFLEDVEPTIRVQRIREGKLYAYAA